MKEEVEKIIAQVQKETDIFNKAKLLLFLRREKDIPLKTIAQRLGLKPAFLCHILRLNRIPEIISDGYYSGLISITHLFILSRIKDQNKMLKIYEQILMKNPTVAKTEQLVREEIYGVKTTEGRLSKDEKEQLIKKIKQSRQEISVDIIQTRIKSKLIIEIKGDLAKTGNLLKNLF